MNKYDFPIASIKGNELISTKGDNSYFFKIVSFDLEQFNEIELEMFYSKVEGALNHLSDSHFIKFYRIGHLNYLNTNIENLDIGVELEPCFEPLEVFFGASDIYSNLGIYDDYLLYNGKYKRIITVKEFSDEEIDHNFIPKGVDYVLNFRRKESVKALSDLDRIRQAHRVSSTKSKTDFESEGAYAQAEELIESLTHGEESIFDMELSFILEAHSLEELDFKTMGFVTELRLKGIGLILEGHSFKSCKSGLFEVFKNLIVGVTPSFDIRSIPNKTSHLKYLLPLDKSYLMGSGIAFSDIDENAISFDVFNSNFKSRNMLVTGSTGSGKSVFVNKLIHSLISNHPAVILDKGGSFKKVCLYHGGYNLESGINPLSFKCPYYLREFVLSVVDKELFKKRERGLLLKEIKSFVGSYNGDCFFDLVSHLEKSFSGIHLYFEDLKDFITSDKSDLSNLLYVDIENYPGSQVAPLIIYLLEYFKNIKESQKVLVFDECWSFLKDHGEYIDECFRTFRKTGAFPIAISQGLSDFAGLGDGLYSSLTNNSYFKVFFPQESIEGHDVTDFDNKRIKSLQYEKGIYSECYLKSQDGKIKKIIRILLGPLEYELFHTEAGQSKRLFKFVDDHSEYFETNRECINSFVRLHHASA